MDVLLLIGLLLLAGGLFFLYDYKQFAARSEELPGKMIAVAKHEVPGSKGKTTINYHPVIEYHPEKTLQFKSASGYAGYMPYRIGEAVSVLADKENPVQVRIKSTNNLHAGILLSIAGAVLSIIAGSYILFNGSILFLILSIGTWWFGYSKLKTSFGKVTSKLKKVQSNSTFTDSGQAWEKGDSSVDSSNWLYDISAIGRSGSHASYGSLFLLCGVLAIGVGGYWLVDRYAFLSESNSATGTVTSVEKVRRKNSSGVEYTYYPRVKFQTESGQSIEFRREYGDSVSAAYSTGDSVRVQYHSKNPMQALIDRGVIMNYSGYIMLLTFGGIFFTMGLLTLRKKGK